MTVVLILVVYKMHLEPEAEFPGAQECEAAVVGVARTADGVKQLPLMLQPLRTHPVNKDPQPGLDSPIGPPNGLANLAQG